jgi:hypothetical protein
MKICRLKSALASVSAERPPARTRARLRRQATSQRLARSDFNRGDFRRSCSWAHAPATTDENLPIEIGAGERFR